MPGAEEQRERRVEPERRARRCARARRRVNANGGGVDAVGHDDACARRAARTARRAARRPRAEQTIVCAAVAQHAASTSRTAAISVGAASVPGEHRGLEVGLDVVRLVDQRQAARGASAGCANGWLRPPRPRRRGRRRPAPRRSAGVRSRSAARARCRSSARRPARAAGTRAGVVLGGRGHAQLAHARARSSRRRRARSRPTSETMSTSTPSARERAVEAEDARPARRRAAGWTGNDVATTSLAWAHAPRVELAHERVPRHARARAPAPRGPSAGAAPVGPQLVDRRGQRLRRRLGDEPVHAVRDQLRRPARVGAR